MPTPSRTTPAARSSQVSSAARTSKLALETPVNPPRFKVQLVSGTGVLLFAAVAGMLFYAGRTLSEKKACLSNILLLEHRMAQGYRSGDSAAYLAAIESSGILGAYKCPNKLGAYALESLSATEPKQFTSYIVRCSVHGTAAALREQLGAGAFDQVLSRVKISKEVREQRGLGSEAGGES